MSNEKGQAQSVKPKIVHQERRREERERGGVRGGGWGGGGGVLNSSVKKWGVIFHFQQQFITFYNYHAKLTSVKLHIWKYNREHYRRLCPVSLFN